MDLKSLQKTLRAIALERNWEQFHTHNTPEPFPVIHVVRPKPKPLRAVAAPQHGFIPTFIETCRR